MFNPKFYKLYGFTSVTLIIVFVLFLVMKFDFKFAQADLNDGLVAHWKFNNATTTDATANGNNLTNSGATATTGIYGASNTAFDFENGDQDYMAISDVNQTGLDITGDMGISFWVNSEDTTIAPVVICKWNELSNRSYYVQLRYDANFIRFANNSSGGSSTDGYADVSYTFSSGEWYHVTVNFDASAGEMRAYVNGKYVGSATGTLKTSIYNSNAPFEIGRWDSRYVAAANFDGKLDDVRVYNRVLSVKEISNLATNPDYNGDGNVDTEDTMDKLDDYQDWVRNVWDAELE